MGTHFPKLQKHVAFLTARMTLRASSSASYQTTAFHFGRTYLLLTHLLNDEGSNCEKSTFNTMMSDLIIFLI